MKLTILILLMLCYETQAKEFVVTAYCGCKKCCGKWANPNCRTANGNKANEGITCAASRALPFGTRLKIEGIGIRIVQDRLARKFDSRIDIYFKDHKKALKFGKRKLNVIIL
jgi:3D (Asp-Asp-Asp) domain-containing protein